MVQLRARVDLEAMAIKEYSAFPKASALLELHHQIQFSVISRILVGGGGILLLCRDAVSVLTAPANRVVKLWFQQTPIHSQIENGSINKSTFFMYIVNFNSIYTWNTILSNFMTKMKPSQYGSSCVCLLSQFKWQYYIYNLVNEHMG